MTTITVLILSIAVPTTATTIIEPQEDLAQTNDDITLKTYENPTYGINIQYPSNWRVDEGDVYSDDYIIDIVSFIAPITSDSEAYSPSLSLSIDTPPPNLNENLNEYLTRITNEYGDTLNDFEVIESDTNSILAGKPAYKLVSTDVEDDINYKSLEIGTIIGNKVYYVTYYAEEEEYSNYLPTVQKMISSLELNTSDNELNTDTFTATQGSDEINPYAGR